MTVSIAINGFGRIGRMVFRKAMAEDLDIVAINASYPSETLAHLIKYDTTHGRFDGSVEAGEDFLVVNGKRIQLIGSTLRTRDDAFKAKLLAELEQQVWPLFAQQQLNPQLSRQYSICDAKQAFAELAGNQVNGKLVLVFD